MFLKIIFKWELDHLNVTIVEMNMHNEMVKIDQYNHKINNNNNNKLLKWK